jgi:hypothetical protein
VVSCGDAVLGVGSGLLVFLQGLAADECGDALEKTWIKRGELRGFCGKFAGRYFAMVRG